MAVFRVRRPFNYYGLSTDSKPTDVGGRRGSLFTELDTGHVFVWSGAQWEKVESHNRQVAIVDLSVNSTTVSSNPARLHAIHVNVAIAVGAVEIKDDTTTIFNLPIGLDVGSERTYYGIQFDTSLVIDPSDIATGEVAVLWEPA